MENKGKHDKFFKTLEEHFPMGPYRTENGYLALNEKQKSIIREKTFPPRKHVFAAVTEGSGIKCYSMYSDAPEAFKRYIEKCEQNIDVLPYVYLGVADENGKISI